MTRAAIYDPYWDTLGGGERYVASFAKFLESKNYAVDIWWPTDLTEKITNRFGINLETSKFIPYNPLENSHVNRLLYTRKYDLVFWVSDGSIPASLANKTIVHMQVPAHWQGCGTLSNRLKIKLCTVVCNSRFTKSVIDNIYHVDSKVVYPPVAIEKFTPGSKQNVIVSIGRLAHLLHAKRQDALIKAFAKLHSKLPGWKLILAGGSKDQEYISHLKTLIEKLPIEIIKNPSLDQIRQLLGSSKMFWSATGFGSSSTLHPERMEHFGITTVEAMAAGCVPIVTDSGGHLETVRNKENGFLWHTLEQLERHTLQLATDQQLYNRLQAQGLVDCNDYSIKKFNHNFSQII